MRVSVVLLAAAAANTAQAGTTYQLNAVQLLLPYTAPEAHRVNYLLKADGGCFEWYVHGLMFTAFAVGAVVGNGNFHSVDRSGEPHTRNQHFQANWQR
jgi:hypothetical protein